MIDTAVLITLFGLTTAISWGIADFLAAKASKSLGPIVSAFLVGCIGAAAFTAIYILFMRPSVTLTLGSFGFAVMGGASIALGLLAFYKGLAKGPVSLVSPISSAYPLITTLLALFIFNARLSIMQLVGIGLILVGVLVAAEIVSLKKPVRRLGTGPAWALLTILAWGAGFALLAQAIRQIGWETTSLIQCITIALVFLLLLPFVKGSEKISFQGMGRMVTNKFIVGAGVMQLVGVVTLNLGFSVEEASGAIVTAISACYPALTIFLALRHFKENVKLLPLAGGFVSIIGVIVVSIS